MSIAERGWADPPRIYRPHGLRRAATSCNMEGVDENARIRMTGRFNDRHSVGQTADLTPSHTFEINGEPVACSPVAQIGEVRDEPSPVGIIAANAEPARSNRRSVGEGSLQGFGPERFINHDELNVVNADTFTVENGGKFLGFL